MSAIRSMDSKIVLTTHYMEEAQELCEEIAIINNGKLVDKGTPSELLSSLEGKVRVEGVGDIKIGNIRISYMTPDEAKSLLGKVTIKPISLEDVLITKGLYIED